MTDEELYALFDDSDDPSDGMACYRALYQAGYQKAMEDAKEDLLTRCFDPYLEGFAIIAGHRAWLDEQVKKEGV